ncbi:hypothetical protein SEA_ZUKO_99 [Streptomyces phage Zuko]|uniref:Uncharacterized protein n=1 Tax=Streptomyces phage Zuko TaxID=2601695 RepID=A0A5J6D791_9CAUD|nr:hypothetical protein PP630_gp099 [Streptomyces phage Zuko]QEQ93677.1 hypothetical protein SEA_ZUKO_99 [Streptomyces phage Zuko]
MLDHAKIAVRAAQIAAHHLTQFNPGDFLDALEMFDNSLTRFVWAAIDDARDDEELDDYFTELTSEEYSERYDAVAEILLTIFTAFVARIPRRR